MTKNFLIAGFVAAATATSAIVFGGAPVHAACLPSDPSATCSTFDPSTASNVVDYTGFTGTLTPPAGATNQLSKARIRFEFGGTWTAPFSISNISLTGPGITTSLSFSPLIVNPVADQYTNFVNLDTALSTVDYSTAPIPKLSFTIPANSASNGATITALIQYANGAETQVLTSGGNFSATASVPATGTPSPLPIIGVSAAFGLSRRVRQKIKQVA